MSDRTIVLHRFECRDCGVPLKRSSPLARALGLCGACSYFAEENGPHERRFDGPNDEAPPARMRLEDVPQIHPGGGWSEEAYAAS